MRLSQVPLAELDEVRAHLHREIASGRRADFFRSIGVDPAGALPGPFNAMVRAPQVGRVLHRVGEALRYDGVLPDLVRESVILSVAVAKDSPFEWRSHEPIARAAGADDALLDALRTKDLERIPDDRCRLAVAAVAPLLAGGSVNETALETVRAKWGEEGAVELVVLAGYYVVLADLMRTFESD
jgi:4-carboxymuconolactone decarboxylase